MTVNELCLRALDDLRRVFERLDDAPVERAVGLIAGARRIALYGCGREGLQIRGLCMRLFHLGLDVAMVGDMTAPALGPGDLLILSSGTGQLATAMALLEVAKAAGAAILVVTAQPDGPCPRAADHVLIVPAQTMADDMGADDTGAAVSVLPMGSLFEGAEFVLFEAMVLRLRDRLGVTPEAMRARHTNLE
ncbi:MAG TPA: SIS domain-containing protein [Acetobacteraceae bacterium]|nr:SIS domain-containing protein [Acetobacteraceae bacterium]